MSSPGFAFSKDNELQIDFENQFGYALTADQQRSVDEIKLDMENLNQWIVFYVAMLVLEKQK